MNRRLCRNIVLAIAALVALAAGCRQVLGVEEAQLLCPPELPDCKMCETVDDCDAPTDCHSWKCADSLCTPVNAAPGTECSSGVCSDDPVSQCVACLLDQDCPDGGTCSPSNECVAK